MQKRCQKWSENRLNSKRFWKSWNSPNALFYNTFSCFFKWKRFGNRCKNHEKSMPKRSLKNIGKSMPKCLPKSLKICPKSDLEATSGHWFFDFWPFGAMQKIHGFLMCLQWPKKSEKSAQVAAKGLSPVTGNYFLGAWAPGAAPFRARKA